jgi:hypothetical protein
VPVQECTFPLPIRVSIQQIEKRGQIHEVLNLKYTSTMDKGQQNNFRELLGHLTPILISVFILKYTGNSFHHKKAYPFRILERPHKSKANSLYTVHCCLDLTAV